MKNILNKKINFLILSFFLFLFPVLTAKADGTATTGISGNSSVYVGKTIDVVLYVSTNAPIAAFQGTLKYDTSKLELVSQTSLAPYEISLNGFVIGGLDLSGNSAINGKKNLLKLRLLEIPLLLFQAQNSQESIIPQFQLLEQVKPLALPIHLVQIII